MALPPSTTHGGPALAHQVAKDALADHVCTWQNRTWAPKEEVRV